MQEKSRYDIFHGITVTFIVISFAAMIFFIIAIVRMFYYYEPHLSSYPVVSEYSCQYPECFNIATKKLECNNFGDKLEQKRIMQIPNEANFSVTSDGFNYTPETKRRVEEKGIYLVPKSDGSWKVEERSEWKTITEKGNTYNVSYVHAYGYYCEEHCDTAKNTILDEFKTATLYKSPSFYIGIYCFPALVIASIVFGIITHKVGNEEWKMKFSALKEAGKSVESESSNQEENTDNNEEKNKSIKQEKLNGSEQKSNGNKERINNSDFKDANYFVNLKSSTKTLHKSDCLMIKKAQDKNGFTPFRTLKQVKQYEEQNSVQFHLCKKCFK